MRIGKRMGTENEEKEEWEQKMRRGRRNGNRK